MGNTDRNSLDPMALARLVQAVTQRQTAAGFLGQLLGPFASQPPEQPMTEEQSRMGVTYPAAVQPADILGLLAGSTRTGPGRAVLGSERGAIGKKVIEEGTKWEGRMGYRWSSPGVDDLQLQKLRQTIKNSEFSHTNFEQPLINITKQSHESIGDLHQAMSQVLEKGGAKGMSKWKVDNLFERAGLPNRRSQEYENWLIEQNK